MNGKIKNGNQTTNQMCSFWCSNLHQSLVLTVTLPFWRVNISMVKLQLLPWSPQPLPVPSPRLKPWLWTPVKKYVYSSISIRWLGNSIVVVAAPTGSPFGNMNTPIAPNSFRYPFTTGESYGFVKWVIRTTGWHTIIIRIDQWFSLVLVFSYSSRQGQWKYMEIHIFYTSYYAWV